MHDGMVEKKEYGVIGMIMSFGKWCMEKCNGARTSFILMIFFGRENVTNSFVCIKFKEIDSTHCHWCSSIADRETVAIFVLHEFSLVIIKVSAPFPNLHSHTIKCLTANISTILWLVTKTVSWISCRRRKYRLPNRLRSTFDGADWKRQSFCRSSSVCTCVVRVVCYSPGWQKQTYALLIEISRLNIIIIIKHTRTMMHQHQHMWNGEKELHGKVFCQISVNARRLEVYTLQMESVQLCAWVSNNYHLQTWRTGFRSPIPETAARNCDCMWASRDNSLSTRQTRSKWHEISKNDIPYSILNVNSIIFWKCDKRNSDTPCCNGRLTSHWHKSIQYEATVCDYLL